MDPFTVQIVCREDSFGDAVAERLSQSRRNWRLAVRDYPVEAGGVIVTDDPELASLHKDRSILLDGSLPASSITALIDERYLDSVSLRLPRTLEPDKNAVFTLFTSYCGGQGVSTCAALMARYLSRVREKNVLLLCFDPYVTVSLGSGADPASGAGEDAGSSFERLLLRLLAGVRQGGASREALTAALRTDGFGVRHTGPFRAKNPLYEADGELLRDLMDLICSSSIFDHVILDIPCSLPALGDLSPLCEFRFAVEREERSSSSRAALAKEMERRAADEGAVFEVFSPQPDEYAGFLDVYGQLGSEVTKLAEKHSIG